MSERAKDEPAFPTDAQSGLQHDHYEGMTLRDYFAAHAPPVPLDSPHLDSDGIPFTHQFVAAKWAYAYADAMLATREGGAA